MTDTTTDDRLAMLSPERREAVMRLLQQASQQADPGPARRSGTGPAPLSASQNTLWLVDRIDPGRASYNVPFCFRLTGHLDVEALRRALASVIDRHEALRTYVQVDGEDYLQGIVPPGVRVDFDEHRVDTTEQAHALANGFAEQGFDLTRPFLWRTHLVHVGEQEAWLVFNVHHLVFDGWSASVLQPELSASYAAEVRGERADLGPEPLQFADFSEWQRETLVGDRVAEHVDYWRRHLAGFENLQVPTDRPLPSEVTYDGTFVSVRIEGVMRHARELARRQRASAYTTYVAAFAVLMSKYSGQEDVIFGSPTANRAWESVERTIGFFINMMPLRVDLSGDPTFEEVLARTDELIKQAQVHAELPFEQIVAAVRPPRDPSRSALFQVAMTLQDASGGPLELAGLEVEPVWLDPKASRFQMSWNFIEHADHLEVNVELNTSIFEPSTVTTMVERFGRLMTCVAEQPTIPISRIALLDEAARQAEVGAGVGPTRARSQGTVPSRFAAAAAAGPDAAAVATDAGTTTYRELADRVGAVRAALTAAGVGAGAHVGVLARRDADLPAALLAVMALGAVYVPLDPANPPLRNADVADDAALTHLVGHHELLAPLLDALPADRSGPSVVTLEDLPPSGEAAGDLLEGGPAEEDTAYLLYTSGSSGRPKGVLVTHHNVVSFVDNVHELFELTTEDRILGYASVGFDVSIFEMLAALTTGASVHLVPLEKRLDVQALQDFVADHRITVTDLPPSVMSLLEPEHFADLRIVFVGGEAFSQELVDRWGRGRRFFNGYGPTECTVTMIVHECEVGTGTVSPPIGHPMVNHVAHVVDDRGDLVAPGIAGELVVGGAGLARGYWRRPEQDAAAFVPDPFGTTPDGRLYRTGDIVRRGADGALTYLGRRDGQVKINGVRIELGEIEARLRALPAVRQAVVVPRTGPDGRKQLVGYVVGAAGAELDPAAVRRDVSAHLVPAMVPAHVVVLDEIPLNRSGKVDRERLPEPDLTTEGEVEGPVNETERRLVEEIYQPLLQRDAIDVTEGFFEAGGSSLQAAQLLSRIRRVFDVTIPLTKFFRDSSVRTMALRVDRAKAAQMDPDALVAMLATMSDAEAERLLAGDE